MGKFVNTNRDLTVKRIDRFVLSFYRYPENVSNLMAENVRSVSRPSIDIQDSEIYKKGRNIYQPATARFGSVSIEFYDDNQSIIIDALYRQIYRQIGRAEAFDGDESARFDQSKFDLGIKCYNNLGDNVEEYVIKNAYISSITPGELNVSSESDSIITIDIQFDDLEYKFDR